MTYVRLYKLDWATIGSQWCVTIQKQTAVTAYFSSEQLLLFVFADYLMANSSKCYCLNATV